MSGGLNPNASSFEFNSSAAEFVPSFPMPTYYQKPRPVIYPPIFTYDPHPDISFIFEFPPNFYIWHDGQIYLKDGSKKIFGPFNEEDQDLFYQRYLADRSSEAVIEEKKVKEDDNSISFSDFMKNQENRLKTQGPRLGYREVAVVGTDKVVQEQVVIEEEKIIAKVKIEKPKIKLVLEKPVDKSLLISKLRENPDINPENLLNEPDPHSDPVNIVFIGHVDAGKSTICGNILLLTGKIKKRTIEMYEQEAKEKGRDSWWLAYIMDQNEEERVKGITVEVGRAFFETPSKRFTILDAPGHKSYVPNMISGASQADYAALVISARISEFETGFDRGGQTREHAMLARSFGVTRLIVIVNKMDDPSVNWSQDRFEQIKREMVPYLANTCKYSVDTEVVWVPISGLSGENILAAVTSEHAAWYKGPTLLEVFDKLPLPNRNTEDALRVPVIDRSKDQGLTIFGKVENGLVVKGLKVIIMPIKAKAEVTEIIGGEETKLMYAKPGENVKIKLKMNDEIDIQRGYVLCDVHSVCHIGTEFKADVQFLELIESKMIITGGFKCILHLHTSIEECEVMEVYALFDTEKKKKVKTVFARNNQRVLLKIKTNNEVCIEKWSVNSQLGRFVLRDKGLTIALGKIIDVNENIEINEDV